MSFKDHNGLGVEYPQHPKHKIWLAQKERWKHTQYLGSARMTMCNMAALMENRSTVTDESKALASQIWNLAAQLEKSLKIRKSGT